MKMSRWVLKITDKNDNSNNYKKIEPISFEHENLNDDKSNERCVCVNFVEKNVEPKFYSRMKLSPIECIKLGTKLICMGVESIRQGEYKPSVVEIKGFDECVFFIKHLINKNINLSSNSPRIASVSNLRSIVPNLPYRCDQKE